MANFKIGMNVFYENHWIIKFLKNVLHPIHRFYNTSLYPLFKFAITPFSWQRFVICGHPAEYLLTFPIKLGGGVGGGTRLGEYFIQFYIFICIYLSTNVRLTSISIYLLMFVYLSISWFYLMSLLSVDNLKSN